MLDHLGQEFERDLETGGIHWLTLTDEERRSVALQLLKEVPVLWIWDNVEPITGFPKKTPSVWTPQEQRDLADFLSAARATKAKFLLTSRRNERDWLHDLPGLIELPPMPFYERVQMTAELAKKHGRHLEEVEDWSPLLQFTQGNPMTLTIVVGQALRDGLRSRGQIEAYVLKLRAGEPVFDDEETEGRDRSLAASLAYGFENAFTDVERKQLALLYLFQGFVDVAALRVMGRSGSGWCLSEVRGLTRDAGIALLDRAAEIGLLTALGEGNYIIHPALPWFFRRLFDQHFGAVGLASRAFVEAMGAAGNYYFDQFSAGNATVVDVISHQEANLLSARDLARANGWWNLAVATMQGMRPLYHLAGRRAEWARLAEEIVPDFVDPATQGPLPEREKEWSVVNDYRVQLARENRRWESAQPLQELAVRWCRQRAAAALEKPPETWDAEEKNRVRTLFASLCELAGIQRLQRLARCVEGFEEALALAERIGESQGAAACAFSLGQAFDSGPFARKWW